MENLVNSVGTEREYGFDDRLLRARTSSEVLGVYLSVKKETDSSNTSITERTAARLLELGDTEGAMRFIEMANLERALLLASRDLGETITNK